MPEEHQIHVGRYPQHVGVEDFLIADDADRLHRQQQHQNQDRDALVRRQRRPRNALAPFGQLIARQPLATAEVDDEPNDHADARSAKAIVPAQILPQGAGDQRRDDYRATDEQVIDLIGIGTPQVIGA